MKNSLGNIVLFLSFIFVSLVRAEDFEYKIEVDKKQPYLKEVVVLTIELNQINPDIVLMFDFDLLKSKDYDFKRIQASEIDLNHNTKASYRYLVYPLNSDEVEIEFKLTKKVTTDENVAYSFSGDRDNVKGLVTTDTEVKLPPLKLAVKPLPNGVSLVGDFSLNYELKKQSFKAYEPIPMLLHVEGDGYPPEFSKFPLLNDDIKIFADRSISEIKTTNTTTKSKTTYPIAFSSAKNFKLQKVVIGVFNPKTKKSYQLTLPKLDFDIESVRDIDLLDKVDMPKSNSADFAEITNYLGVIFSYIIVFLAGGSSGYLFNQKKKRDTNISQNLRQKIENSTDEKELLQLLLSADGSAYGEPIKQLEGAVYSSKKISFNEVKTELLLKFKFI